MEGFSTPQYSKIITRAARQALPHRPAEPPLHTPCHTPALFLSPARQCYPKLLPLRPARSLPNKPLRLAKPEIHKHSQSLPGHTLRLAQACRMSALPCHTLKACHAGDPHMHDLCSTGPCSPGLHRPALISIPSGHAAQACHAGDPHTSNLHSAQLCPPGLHRPAQYPFHKPVPLRPAKPGINTHTISVPPASPPGLHRLARSLLC
jgi:hypothetical protein